jgi:large subunit ribosomal protein L18
MARYKKKLFGTKERPRLAVFRSLKNIHAQVIDDSQGKTLAAASSLKEKKGGNLAAAKKVGATIASKAKAAGVTKVIFDRGTSLFHGRVKALADAAREGGLLF